ncbi:MAG: DUF4230 domain-containing protein [Phycisphaera sp.]|nr:DUF4230 domain-containing protein [Phycisphaera sp.]
MFDWLPPAILGALAALGVMLLIKRGSKAPASTPSVSHSIQQLKAVGELVVFRLVTQQIVAQEEHLAGQFGKNWLKWLLSARKMALIIEYGMDFKFDLRDEAFTVSEESPGHFVLTLPPCQYQANVRNIQFYDETNSRWLPWLLGDLTEALGPGFSETDKNRLIDGARKQADEMANRMVSQLSTEVQSSARQTLESVAKSFGAQRVTIQFNTKQAFRGEPSTAAPAAPAAPAPA